MEHALDPAAYGSPALDLAALESRLKPAFVARFGPELGAETTAEVMAWAWEHRHRLDGVSNPSGYLFRVGQSRSRRFARWRKERTRFPPEQHEAAAPWTEPGLPAALARLRPEQRTAVVLVHCFQWTYAEVAEMLDLPLHTVRNRIHRGMASLRRELGVEPK